jgi:hypothetical protein
VGTATGKAVEVADQEGEEADVEGFLDEVGEHILVSAPGPEQTRDRHVEDDEVEARNATSPPSRPKPESM